MVKNSLGFALFGGSFDPPHLGHRTIIEEILKFSELQGVIITPTWLNPFKEKSHASSIKRLKWCHQVFDYPNVIISDYEIEQQRPVYTIETYQALKKEYPIKYLIIGSDNLTTITKWRDFSKLNQELIWIIATRDNINPDISMLKNAKILPIKIPISSTKIRLGEGLEYIDSKIYNEVIETYHIKKEK